MVVQIFDISSLYWSGTGFVIVTMALGVCQFIGELVGFLLVPLYPLSWWCPWALSWWQQQALSKLADHNRLDPLTD